jgi:hypothetical protein
VFLHGFDRKHFDFFGPTPHPAGAQHAAFALGDVL